MRLAVVDDNPRDREELLCWLKTALNQRRKPVEYLAFADGTSFLDAAGRKPFDLVFLDIYMEGMDGVTVARALRGFDPDCVLVFTTTSTDHALDGYRVRALQYLVKPYQMAEVEEVLEEVLSHLPPEEAVIRLPGAGGDPVGGSFPASDPHSPQRWHGDRCPHDVWRIYRAAQGGAAFPGVRPGCACQSGACPGF